MSVDTALCVLLLAVSSLTWAFSCLVLAIAYDISQRRR